MTNKYLEKVASAQLELCKEAGTVGAFLDKGVSLARSGIKTVKTAMGGEMRTIQSRQQGLRSMANQQIGAARIIQKNGMPNTQPHVQKAFNKAERFNQRADSLAPKLKDAELDMHRSRSTVAKGGAGLAVAGVGANMALGGGNNSSNNYSY